MLMRLTQLYGIDETRFNLIYNLAYTFSDSNIIVTISKLKDT